MAHGYLPENLSMPPFRRFYYHRMQRLHTIDTRTRHSIRLLSSGQDIWPRDGSISGKGCDTKHIS